MIDTAQTRARTPAAAHQNDDDRRRRGADTPPMMLRRRRRRDDILFFASFTRPTPQSAVGCRARPARGGYARMKCRPHHFLRHYHKIGCAAPVAAMFAVERRCAAQAAAGDSDALAGEAAPAATAIRTRRRAARPNGERRVLRAFCPQRRLLLCSQRGRANA